MRRWRGLGRVASGRDAGSGIDRAENLCLLGADFHVRADLSHLPGFLCPAKSERNDWMEKRVAGEGSERERNGEHEEAKRGRERSEIEMPQPHIGNINPSFPQRKRGGKKVAVWFYTSPDSIHLNTSVTWLKKRGEDCGVSLSGRYYRHPRNPRKREIWLRYSISLSSCQTSC